jgi:hypothetical protein
MKFERMARVPEFDPTQYPVKRKFPLFGIPPTALHYSHKSGALLKSMQ